MGAHGDIISRGIPGITSRAHRSPHKLTLSPACRPAPAPRRTISSIFLLSSLISSASLPAGSRFVLAWGRMWLWRSGCHPSSVTGGVVVSPQGVGLCPQQPKPGVQLLGTWRFQVWRFHQRRKMAHRVVLSTK